MRIDTGGMMSLVKGALYSGSTRQKLKTKSSTEANIVGANNFMPQTLQMRYFLEAQGYSVNESVMYQDNQSTMLLESNGMGSSSKRIQHINIRSFYYLPDRLQGSGSRVLSYRENYFQLLRQAFPRIPLS